MLTDGKGNTVCADAQEFLDVLGPEDGANSVDMGRYQEGERDRGKLVRPYLAGGLINGAKKV